MGVTINLHKVYQQYADNQDTVITQGDTVCECLMSMIEKYPDLEKAIFIEKERLHPLVEIYLNSTSAYPDALNKKVNDGDMIYLIHKLAGG